MIDSVCKEVGLLDPKGTNLDAQVDLCCTIQCKEEPSYSISPSKEEENIKRTYDKSSDFCRNHVYLHPHDPLEYENISLAYEGYKMKDNCGERKSLQRDCSGEENIHEGECELEENQEDDVVKGGKTSCVLDTKEGHI